ncbi:hypothetical protein [Streptacidiphilus monticola]|uniref:LPXTG cell wall anchor domain-containing protein n=1 Tax=Streptacidiphilus monticola TaxID=2161674 RepID=A0ABW1FXC1_9ACTN
MNYFGNKGQLAATGAGTITIAGIAFNQLALLGVAAGIVIAGAVLVRLTWRRGKSVGDQ